MDTFLLCPHLTEGERLNSPVSLTGTLTPSNQGLPSYEPYFQIQSFWGLELQYMSFKETRQSITVRVSILGGHCKLAEPFNWSSQLLSLELSLQFLVTISLPHPSHPRDCNGSRTGSHPATLHSLLWFPCTLPWNDFINSLHMTYLEGAFLFLPRPQNNFWAGESE